LGVPLACGLRYGVHVRPGLYLANDTGLVRLGVLGDNHWPADETLMGQKGKSQGCLGADRDSSLVNICDASVGHTLLEIVDNVRVVV
jgi:hypothetical protein